MPARRVGSSRRASPEPARVALVPADTADAVIAPIFRHVRAHGGVPLNMHRAVANAPTIFKAYFDLAMAIRSTGHTTRADRELVILRSTYRTRGDYERALHIPMAKSAGLTVKQIKATARARLSPAFDDRQRAILKFVDEMTTPAGVTDRTFDALCQFYDDQAIVELTITAAYYIMGAHITHTLNVKADNIKLQTYGLE